MLEFVRIPESPHRREERRQVALHMWLAVQRIELGRQAVVASLVLKALSVQRRRRVVRTCDRTACPDQLALRRLYKTPWCSSSKLELCELESKARESYPRRLRTSINYQREMGADRKTKAQRKNRFLARLRRTRSDTVHTSSTYSIKLITVSRRLSLKKISRSSRCACGLSIFRRRGDL